MGNFFKYISDLFYLFWYALVLVACSTTFLIISFSSIIYLNKLSPIGEVPLIFLMVSIFVTSIFISIFITENIFKK